MAENAPRWPMVDGTYLEVVDCLGTALAVVLGGDMNFQNCGWFCDGFGDWVDFSTRECEGFGGGGRGAERIDGFKQVLPSDVNTYYVSVNPNWVHPPGNPRD